MKKLLFDILLLSIVWALFYFLFSYLLTLAGINGNHFVFGISVQLWVVSITYKRLWGASVWKKPFKWLVFGGINVSILILFSYAYSLNVRTMQILNYLSTEKTRGWKGNVHQSDSIMGFVPVPNAKGFHTFPIGDDIPMAYDKNGFRIPLSDTSTVNNYDSLSLLFLGCSFTYGDACYAEQTFPFLTAKETNRNYINAGVCSYGLAHMVLLAQKLIPIYKPEYVVVQHSPWLVERAVSMYAPVYFGSMPVPYFIDNGTSIEVNYPYYPTRLFDPLLREIKENKNFKNKYLKLAMYVLREDIQWVVNKLMKISGKYKKPASDIEKTEYLAYENIIKIARQYNTKVIMLGISNNTFQYNQSKYSNRADIIYLDTDTVLKKYMKENNLADYSRAFCHWKIAGKDTIMVDAHFNPLAHQLTSDLIVKNIKAD